MRLWMACIVLFCVNAVCGQTLAIHNDIQTYASLPGTTVTLTGRSELRITGASSPIAGSVIHLNSTDSWLFMTNIRPSVVSSTYLSQIRVNGAAAAINTNCRIVQHVDGSVVIPHSSGFSPMQVYAGRQFMGSSISLQNYTAYNDGSLGAFANNISSFKLKRGYTATIAQNASGTGVSRNYVAQDGDIEVSVLPDELDNSVSFIRVFPWRWTGKKGMVGNISSGLNVRWDYNWNIDRNSTLDMEYVPIRQLRYWPDLASQNWNTRGSNHLLGYNEPDQVEQANISVGDAIWSWPDLLGTGLRVGSPAPSDGALNWLYTFTDQADAADLRVDFVAVHYYRSYSSAADPDGATTQFYNFLKGVYDRVKRPLWVTEWNNGANWTTGPDPTVAQQAATVAKMMEMLDNTPFVERYSLYNWVEDSRRVKWDDGSLTAAGVVYRDKVSPLSYQQVIPEVPTSPAALYQFENDTRDSSAFGHSAMLKGGAKFTTGHTGQAVVMSGAAASGDHVQLSTRLGDSTDFTFGAWIYPTGTAEWQRVFDLGSSTTRYLFLTPAAGGTGNVRFAIADGGAEQQLNHSAPLPLNTWSHVAVTISGNTGKLFVNGVLSATNPAMTINPVSIGTTSNFLGKSQFAADPLFAGKLDDVQFLPYALADSKVMAMTTNHPPQFTAASITGTSASQGVAYNSTVAGSATDADAGDSISYSKVSGPAWLMVAANGALTGTPSFDDAGNQEFIILATDTVGATAYTLLTIQLPSVSGNGTWTSDSSGNWSDTTKWTAAFPANGSNNSGNFSTLNLAADRTVTLDASRTIGSVQFGDSAGPENWTLAAANGSALTLAVASGSPAIAVNQNTATITASLDGTAGFTKSGGGTLVLKGDNSLSGVVVVGAVGGSNSGVVRFASLNAARNLNGLQILNNNLGYSTLELDGTLGGVITPTTAPVSLSGRNNSIPAIRNLAGNNTLAGNFTIDAGGGSYLFQSDAGTLNLNGAFTSAATGSRVLTFLGAGNSSLNGALSNGSATTGISIVKNGVGTLVLTGANIHTGSLTVNGGTVTLSGPGHPGTASISLAPGTTLNINRNLPLTNTVTGSGAIQNTGSTTVTGDFSAFSGSYTHTSTVVSTAFNTAFATSRNASYTIASEQGASQGFIAGGNGDYTLELGALNGVAGSLFRGGNTATGTTTLRVGNLNATDTFAGSISNGVTKTIALNKVGTGIMTLSGVSSYTGATLVSGGSLLVNGSTGASVVTVATGGTLGGTGTVGGGVSVQSGGNLAPGAGGIGRLTTSGGLVLQAGATTRMEIHKAAASRDVLSVVGPLTLGGNLIVSNLGGTLAGDDSFDLFEGGAITGSFSSITLPALDFGFAWDTTALGSGMIRVLPVVTTYPGWASNHVFPQDASASTADADNDGIANVFEWLFGSDPLSGDPSFLPQPLVRTVTAAEYPAGDPAKHYLTMTARVRKTHTGATLVPQAGSSLESLDAPASNGLVTSFPASDLGDFEVRTWVHTTAIEDSPGGSAFMRLKVVSE